MTSPVTAPHRRRWPRWLVSVAIMVGVGVLLLWRDQLRQARAQALTSEIQAMGGQVYEDTTLWQLVQRWWAGYPVNWKAGRMVTFFNMQIDSEWLHERDNLADLQIAYLYFGPSAVTTDDAVRIIDRHPLQAYSAVGQADADTIAAALAHKSRLTDVELVDADLTDAGLRRLPLEQLEVLFVEGTRVTPAGLGDLHRCGKLTDITIDGHQLDESVVATLASLPALERVSLVGTDITDENVTLIVALQKLEYLHLQYTMVTKAAADKLTEAMPATVVDVQE